MPKKNNDSYEAFLADIVSRIPEDRRGTVEEIFGLDDVRTELQRGYSRQSDYSRNMDALRREREEFEAVVAEANANIEGWQQWYEEKQQEIESMGNRHGVEDQVPLGVSREDFEAELARRDQLAIAYADMLTDIKLEHRTKFNERLDTGAVVKLAMEQRVPLNVAYEQYIRPREDERRKKDMEDQLAKAREEGAREYATKHRLPIASGPVEPHPLDMAPKVATGSRDRVAAAVAAFNNAAS